MELYEGLISRRSIRKYSGEHIEEDSIMAIIRAGMYAPSARNKRPWHFIIIDDRAILKMIMGIRVSAEEEYEGVDIGECGLEAYPEFTGK